MEPMTDREKKITVYDLKEYNDKIVEINNLLERIARLESDVELRSQRIDGMPRSRIKQHHDKIASRVAEIINLKGIYRDLINKLSEETAVVEKEIRKIKKSRHREFMRMRYIDGLTFREIAERQGRSREAATRLHKRILKKM
jgi:DNA-directed RNA polymerase specialized sigma subunit